MTNAKRREVEIMSYCRWSSDDYRCDLYCYESEEGYVTHVASLRYVWEPPTPSPYSPEGFESLRREGGGEKWRKAVEVYHAALGAAPKAHIGLPCDGMSFCDPDLSSFRQRIVDLTAMGYRVPSHVLTTIDEDMRDGTPAGLVSLPVVRSLDFRA